MPTDVLNDLLRSGRIDTALEEGERILRESASPTARRGAAQTLARIALAMNDLDRAGEALDEALKSDPKDQVTWALKALLALESGQLQESIEHLVHAVEGREENQAPEATVHEALLRVVSELGAPEESARALERALPKEPAHRRLLEALAVALTSEGKIAQARDLLLASARRRPRAVAWWRVAARLAEAADGPAAGLEVLVEAGAACDSDADLLRAVLRALTESRDADRGRSVAQRLLELVPSNVAVRLEISAYYRITGQLEVALHHLEKARALDPNFSKLRQHHAAMLLAKTGKASPASAAQLRVRARELLEEALALDAEDHDAACDLAVLLSDGDAAAQLRAVELLDAAIEARPEFASALLQRASLHVAAGEKELATELTEQALEHLVPASPEAYRALEILRAAK